MNGLLTIPSVTVYCNLLSEDKSEDDSDSDDYSTLAGSEVSDEDYRSYSNESTIEEYSNRLGNNEVGMNLKSMRPIEIRLAIQPIEVYHVLHGAIILNLIDTSHCTKSVSWPALCS